MFLASPRDTDQRLLPIPKRLNIAWAMSRATRPFPSRKGWIQRRRWWAAGTAITFLNLPRGAVYASSKRFMDLCRSSSPAGGTCRADLDGLRANLPRRYMKPFTRVRVLDPKQFLRQAGAELSMKPADVVQRNRLGLCVLSRIALLLHFDVRHRFDLHISFLRFG